MTENKRRLALQDKLNNLQDQIFNKILKMGATPEGFTLEFAEEINVMQAERRRLSDDYFLKELNSILFTTLPTENTKIHYKESINAPKKEMADA